MKILIRADASHTIGSGHIFRTLELARRLKRAGYEPIYLCRALEGDLRTAIRDQGFRVETLEGNEIGAIARAVETHHPLLLMIDHYGIGIDTERAIKARFELPLFVFDDTYEPHACDYLLNPNLYAEADTYRGLIPDQCTVMAGPQFAALRGEFSAALEQPKLRNRPKKMLITLGGSDPHNHTSRVLNALEALALPLELCVIIGPNNAHADSLLKRCAQMPNCTALSAPGNMAQLMHEADFAVTAAGQTTLETLYMQLPSIAIEVADNQHRIIEYLKAHNLALTLGSDVRPSELIAALAALLTRDAPRTIAIATHDATEPLRCLRYRRFTMRPTVADDGEALFALANDHAVRQNSLNSAAIEMSNHLRWLQQKLSQERYYLFTFVDAADAFMGQLRLDATLTPCVISVSLIPAARGCGIASTLIKEGLRFYFSQLGAEAVKAVIKTANRASQKAFEHCGFKLESRSDDIKTFMITKAEYETDHHR